MAINISQIAVLEHDTIKAWYNDLIKIDGTHFILAYRGTSGDNAQLRTFSIDANYDNITPIDSLNYYATINSGIDTSIVKIDSTHFMVATDATIYARMETFSIDGSYDNITSINALNHDSASSGGNGLVMIDSTHFFLAYSGSGSDGYAKTFSIDGSYGTVAEIAVLEFDTSYGTSCSTVMIDSTHFIVAYFGGASDGIIKTFSIDGSYENIAVENSVIHDSAYGLRNTLIEIDSTHFALIYQGDGGTRVKTFSIDGSYNITEEDNVTLDPAGLSGAAGWSSIGLLDTGYLVITYQDVDGDGRIGVISFDENFDMTVYPALEYDGTYGAYCSLAVIDSEHVIVAHAGNGDDGYIRTFSITITEDTDNSIFFGGNI